MSFAAPIRLVGKLHGRLVHGRRVNVLARALAEQIPASASVLDVGCGGGEVASLILQERPDIRIQGVEVLVRPGCRIPVQEYDGKRLPFPDATFDVCMCIDVLHHTEDVAASLRELARVSRQFLLIKDHLSESRFDFLTLKAMDWVGNRPQGVVLPYRYQAQELWEKQFQEIGLEKSSWVTKISLYPVPLRWITGRKLHFISLLKKRVQP